MGYQANTTTKTVKFQVYQPINVGWLPEILVTIRGEVEALAEFSTEYGWEYSFEIKALTRPEFCLNELSQEGCEMLETHNVWEMSDIPNADAFRKMSSRTHNNLWEEIYEQVSDAYTEHTVQTMRIQ